MSEFMDKFSVSRIIGSPPGYVGYDDAGQLTEKIRRRPYSVVLFDEIEKAHPDVMNILLQILDDGIITDSHGKQVDFCNTIIVMTTNAGSTYATAKAGFSDLADTARTEDKTRKALEEFLRPEFINRVDEIITFNALSRENFIEIARIMTGDLTKLLYDKGMDAHFTEACIAHIADKSYSAKYGARNMRRFIQTEIEDKIAAELIAARGLLSEITVDCVDDTLRITAE
ncbi:MAG: ATP-dependent Clp protease ATP-binding subunit, partial [Clostridia bacterium]|nr:ATP-dependent Clp protease ATP-binding subunit [Clostridia bacterium]